MFVRNVAQSECPKHARMKHEKRGRNQNMPLLWHVCHRMRNGRAVTKRANGRSWYHWCAFSAARDDVVQDVLWVGFVGQVLRDVIGNCANQRNLGGAMSHDGSFISWTQAESFAWDGASTMYAYLPIPIWIERFKESTDASPIVRNRSVSPQWCRAWRRWQRTVCKSFVNSTYVVSVAASPCCSIEIACNQVNLMTNHDGSDCEDEFLCNTPVAWRGNCQYVETTPWWTTKLCTREYPLHDPSLVSFHHLIRQIAPGVMKVNGLDVNIGVQGVLVVDNRASLRNGSRGTDL